MKTVIVMGYGRMGKAITHALTKLGHMVVAVDKDSDNAKKVDLECDASIALLLDEVKPDGVVSSLPYFCNRKVASYCIQLDIPYFDLGGCVPESEAIHEYCQKNGGTVFTDLGLAPGWVNIQAVEAFKTLDDALNPVPTSKDYVRNIDEIAMFCGGLPVNHDINPAGYICTWSEDGLINEYLDNCCVLKDGKQEWVQGMSGLEQISAEGHIFEAFHTSGGSAHTIQWMQDHGVKNCAYKTLRYPGHNRLMKWMLGSLSYRDIGKCLRVQKPETTDPTWNWDKVVTLVVGVAGELTWHKMRIVYADYDFTAMQKATGFPCAAVVEQFLGNSNQGVLGYHDIDLDWFNESLRKLGLCS